MKTLHLNLTAKWYTMIESGVKKEEYREIKDYWKKRLIAYDHRFKSFDIVVFSYGYTKRRMAFRVNSVTIGRGLIEWGAPLNEDVYIISLGERIY